MNHSIINMLFVAVLSLSSGWFFFRSRLFEGNRKGLIAVSLFIAFFGFAALLRTEEGPMQSIYLSVYFILAVIAVIDFMKKQVYLELIIAVIPITLVNVILFLDDWTVKKMLFTGGIILFFLIVGALFRGNIGWGDIIVFLLFVVIFEVKDSVFIIFLAFCLSSVFSLVLFIAKKASRKMEIPFMPFLLASYMMYVFL